MTKEELLKTYFANRHILQSREWGEFKTLVGARSVEADRVRFTVHKIPLAPWKVGYAPKIRPEDLDLEKLYNSGRENNCLFIKLDVPHARRETLIPNSKFLIQPGRPIFAQSTILVDLTKTDEELLAAMHEKTRYNLRLAQKKGVTVKTYPKDQPPQGHALQMPQPQQKDALDEFIRLQKETARRQKFFVHPDHYYKTCFETLAPHTMAFLISASLQTPNHQPPTTLASWLLFRYGDVLYYPYGQSDYEFRSYMSSNLLMWESIQLGKRLGCKVFDLWGAAEDPKDEKDPWHGFTRFKLSFGGLHLKLAPTYDLVVNQPLYKAFNLINDLRWKILRGGGGG